MKVLNTKTPSDLQFGHNYSPDELAQYQIDEIAAIPGAELFVYWYEQGSYEGSGNAILKCEGKYHLFSLSHCSCYGPTEDIDENAVATGGYETLDQLLAACSAEYRAKEIQCLAELIRKEELGKFIEPAGEQRRILSLED